MTPRTTPGSAQHPQVLGDQGLRRAELLHQLVHAALALGQLAHDGEADRGGQGAQQFTRALEGVVPGVWPVTP